MTHYHCKKLVKKQIAEILISKNIFAATHAPHLVRDTCHGGAIAPQMLMNSNVLTSFPCSNTISDNKLLFFLWSGIAI